ncbi:hypothetical protein BDV93DRAFT_101807 [Ceratobasidium sp. AG-I]|nr:hypothetical protein BDV93DRAFT_101807 [Ceratobasidium sp. AG-I]
MHIYYSDAQGSILAFTRLVSTVWPMAVDLNLPNQTVYPYELHHFATIPNLSRLVVNLADAWPENGPTPPSYVDRPLRTLEFGHVLKQDFEMLPMREFARQVRAPQSGITTK